jgi:4-hydroxy-L-threonine phosphate dehydrogenase PdxA
METDERVGEMIVTPAHGTAFDSRNIAGLGATEHAFELAAAIGSRLRAAKTLV